MANISRKKLVSLSLLLILQLIFMGCDRCDDDNDDDTNLLIWQLLNSCTCNENSTDYDPLFTDQWHLENTGQGGGTAGEDVNVIPAWNKNYTGKQVFIAIVDDGLDVNHEDLTDGIYLSMNYNYLTNSIDINRGTHGTCVAGVAAARYKNGAGGRGVAPCACIVGYNLLQKFTDADILDAMIRNKNSVSVSNNSWGPPDGTGQLEAHVSSWEYGVMEGLQTGRGGKGIVYTWAGGNGGKTSTSSTDEIDNSNYDGYANFYGVIAIAALADDGQRAFYSEKGANLWVCTYSSGGSSGITTTDITGTNGYRPDDYYESFGGTSSATPLASGVIALMLDANPDLTWRDVKIILANTARQVDDTDGDWQTNGAGYKINHKYGFGGIDAEAAANMAETWTNVGSMVMYTTSTETANTSIPDNNSTGISSDIIVSSSSVTNIDIIEYVAIEIEIDHSDSGDLEITLTAPSTTQSILSEEHRCYTSYGSSTTGSYFDDGATFTFGSARHLGESPSGTWTLTVKDLDSGYSGTLQSWSMTFYGR